jgi:hypothetical protein
MKIEEAKRRFWEEAQKDESYDLGELACSYVPLLETKIEELNEQCDTLSDTVNMLSPYIIGKPESEVVTEMISHYKAIELLKEFAFYCVDASVEEHCEQAVKVQELLRELGHGQWVDEQIEENKANME